jgi:hypothetical protein
VVLRIDYRGGQHAAKTGAGGPSADGAIAFMMRDTQTGEVVFCKISAAAQPIGRQTRRPVGRRLRREPPDDRSDG